MKGLIFIPLLLLLLAGCKDPNAVERVTVEGKYSIEIPVSMTSSSALNEDASLKYQDARRELYIIVIDETTDEVEQAIVDNGLTELYSTDLKGYAELLQDGMEGTITISFNSGPQPATLDGKQSLLYDMEATAEGVDVFYKLAYVRGADRYYQIMTWTLLSKREVHENRMDRMIRSFREI